MALARDDGIRDAEPAGRLSIKFTRLFLFSAIFNHTFDRPKRATLPFEGPPRRAVVVRPSDQRHRGHLEREEHPRLRLVLAELRALRHGARLGGRRARPVKQAVVEHAGAVQEQDGVRDCREPALVRGELRKGRQGNHHERDPAGPLEKVVWVPAQAPQPELRAVVRRRPDDGGAVPVFLGLADEGSHLQVGRVLEDPAARPACGADECPAHRVRRLSVRGYEEHRTREYHRVGVGLHEGVLLLLQPPEALGGRAQVFHPAVFCVGVPTEVLLEAAQEIKAERAGVTAAPQRQHVEFEPRPQAHAQAVDKHWHAHGKAVH